MLIEIKFNWKVVWNLKNYIETLKIATLVPFFIVNVPMADAGDYVRNAAMNDCLYRMKDRAEWIAFHRIGQFFKGKDVGLAPELENRAFV